MPQHDPTPPRRLTPGEAWTIRRWTIASAIASVVLIVAAPFTDDATDGIVALVVGATFATGAIVVPRPTGFRLILAIAAMLCVPVATGHLHL